MNTDLVIKDLHVSVADKAILKVAVPGGAVQVFMLGLYLFPWALLAYYLMKWREIASSN